MCLVLDLKKLNPLVVKVEMIKFTIQLKPKAVLHMSFRLPLFSIIIDQIRRSFLEGIKELIIITLNYYQEAVESYRQLIPTTKMLSKLERLKIKRNHKNSIFRVFNMKEGIFTLFQSHQQLFREKMCRQRLG